MLVETFTSPTNIAVIKYWGKGDVALNTPMNSSASLTLDQADLHTITTIAASKDFEEDKMWLNGNEIAINSRALTCIREVRKLAQDRVIDGNVIVSRADWPQYHIRIASFNTFPTGAGLASSAAGLACFVTCLAKLYCAKEEYPGQLTAIARQGSGSASRSMFGGFVRWEKGEKADGTDSIAVQIADENYWPELRAVILVVSDKEKDTSSTSGMETSRLTSPLLQHRATSVVQPRLAALEEAFLAHDFATFGQLTMQDSNQFHAVCLDTYPPIFYLNDISKAIIRLVHALNTAVGQVCAAYTFDAGPNAVIYTLDSFEPLLVAVMTHYFPPNNSQTEYCNKPLDLTSPLLTPELLNQLDRTGRVPHGGDIKYIFLTRSGPGPQKLEDLEESLIDPVTGLCKENPGPKHKRMRIN